MGGYALLYVSHQKYIGRLNNSWYYLGIYKRLEMLRKQGRLLTGNPDTVAVGAGMLRHRGW